MTEEHAKNYLYRICGCRPDYLFAEKVVEIIKNLGSTIEKKEKQQQTNQKLSKQSLQGFNKEYIEQKARELFNYVYPEEHIFIDTSGNS